MSDDKRMKISGVTVNLTTGEPSPLGPWIVPLPTVPTVPPPTYADDHDHLEIAYWTFDKHRRSRLDGGGGMAERDAFKAAVHGYINTPQSADFVEAAQVEAQHQRDRWGADHDAGKRPEDWIALVTYLLGKATKAHFDGNGAKLLHHIITLGAVASNWHLNATGSDRLMRPGVADGHQRNGPPHNECIATCEACRQLRIADNASTQATPKAEPGTCPRCGAEMRGSSCSCGVRLRHG